MNLEHIRAEIERMRHQISRQRKDIQSLRRAGIGTLPSEALLARMQATVDSLCARAGQACRGAATEISGDQQSYQGPADAIAIDRGFLTNAVGAIVDATATR